MEILGLSSSPSSGGAYALILNEVNGGRRLPIIIGTHEAQAIALELEHIKPPRPMTHDLMVQIIQNLEATVEHVYVNALSKGTFYAQILVIDRGVEKTLDARPSDAIALALRLRTTIYVDDLILREAGITTEQRASTEETVQTESAEMEDDPLTQKASLAFKEIEDLEKELDQAIKNEDYERAAMLRDKLNRMKS